MKTKTYEVTKTKNGAVSIKCLLCGKTSYNQRDVAELYCGNCHKFHEEEVR